jgi:hypothetical protein
MIASGVNIGGWIANWLVADLPYGADVMASLEWKLGQKALAELVFRTAQTIKPSFGGDRWNSDEILRLMAA